MKVIATARDTYQYPEYPNPNWIEGQKYSGDDDGNMLTIESEHGPFRLVGRVRKAAWDEIFNIEEVE